MTSEAQRIATLRQECARLCGFIACVSLATAGCSTAPQPLTTPAVPLLRLAIRAQAVPPHYTNGQPYCVTNKAWQVNCYTWTNPPPSPTGITISWQQPLYFPTVPMTNHVLWSTNSPNGPWTGAIAVPCSNTAMALYVPFDPNVKQAWFKLGPTTTGAPP